MGARAWVNTLKPESSAGLTDKEAMNDADAAWGRLIDMGFSIIQTDEPAALLSYLDARGLRPDVD